MFYSETLLSKTGPLARVWLSANLERKLNKTHILQSNIENSVNAIVDQGQAPMALRLSGQLLLGVVRIYSRKARYLMDDCSEALLKIKMAFRPGNLDLDLGAVNPGMPNPGLNLPELLAEPQEIPMLDESLFTTRPLDFIFGAKDNDPLTWESQPFSDSISIELGRNAPRNLHDEESVLYDDNLDIDVGQNDEPSIELGRHAAPTRPVADDLINDDGTLYKDDLDIFPAGDDQDPTPRPSSEAHAPLDQDLMEIDNPETFAFDLDDTTMAPAGTPADPRPRRDSQSPLSSARSSVLRDFDETVMTEEPVMHQARQPAAKRRRLLPIDTETTLHSSQIKKQQLDRTAILKPISILPKDPILLTLMNMQANGTFVSNIMGDGRTKGWAPELRGILSIEVIRKASSLKRKRDSGVADVDEEEEQAEPEMPETEIPEDEEATHDEGIEHASHHEQNTTIRLSPDEGLLPPMEEEVTIRQASAEEAGNPTGDNFDDTTMPMVHPENQGPVSLGTQHAVHLLRNRFGGSEGSSPSQNRTAHVLFQDLLPETTTSKSDATKMFFEVLVLATKDAVKVEQAEGDLGGPIRIRAKRGLWGAWAETEAGGEIAAQFDQHAPQAVEV